MVTNFINPATFILFGVHFLIVFKRVISTQK